MARPSAAGGSPGAHTIFRKPPKPAAAPATGTEPAAPAPHAVLVAGPAYGVLDLSADGSFRYTPGAGFRGEDAFAYRADGPGGAAAGTAVTLSLSAAGDAGLDGEAPPAPPVVDDGAVGRIRSGPDGSFMYTPGLCFHGPDRRVLHTRDAAGLGLVVVVTLEVSELAEPPTPRGEEPESDGLAAADGRA